MLLPEPTQFSPLAPEPVLPLLLVQELLLASTLRRFSVQLPSSALLLSLQPAWLPERQEPLAPLLAWLLASPQP
ncbi:hypothetical protein [Massilia violaceinigra]|uniref:hypothetical protein n=1 Tax=Massilia violaceinigra TaxID=2045208 RepID=UPI0012FE020E|nr:hypothetical protein [Massilia violaceinigra]